MAQNREGALKAAQTMRNKDPDHFKTIGSKGGKISRNGGFASDIVGEDGMTGKERARAAGILGAQTRWAKKQAELNKGE